MPPLPEGIPRATTPVPPERGPEASAAPATPRLLPEQPTSEAQRRRDRVLDWLADVPEWFTRARLAWMVLLALGSLAGVAFAGAGLAGRVDKLESVQTRLVLQYERIEGWLQGIGTKLHVDAPPTKAAP